MSTTTTNLGLFKYDPVTDGKEVFSIQTALNDNWDILDVKAGSPETVVDGTTWYRRFTDGWKEQGGQVSLSQVVYPFQRPNLSSPGVLGGNSFAVSANQYYSNQYYDYLAVDGSTSTFWCGNGDYTFYNPTPLCVSECYFTAPVGNYFGISGLGTTCLQASNDNSTWVTIGTAARYGNGIKWSAPNNTSYYKYHKVTPWSGGASGISMDELVITATYKSSVANSITFPVAFTNTNYSYTFANQDGGGMDAYVSNKTTTGMTLSNTNSGSASWTACGY